VNPLPVLIFHADQAREMFKIPSFPGRGEGFKYIVLVPVGVYESEENSYERLYLIKATELLKLLGISVATRSTRSFGTVMHENVTYRMFMA
jgi:hypothetical protein